MPSVAAVVLTGITGMLVAYPLGRIAVEALGIGPGDAGFLQPYREALVSPVALSAIWGTVWLSALSVAFGVPLAVLLAWITSSTDAPLARLLAPIPTLSLALSPLVGAMGWLVLLTPRVGLLNLLVRHLLGLTTQTGPFNAFSLKLVVMLTTFYVVPYIYGPAYGALSQIDGALVESARICGANPRLAAFSVMLPVIRPAILAGSLIAGVMAASMFAIPLILASGTGLHVIPTEIYQYINQEGRIAPALAMASLLTCVTAAAMAAYGRLLGRRRFVTVTGKRSRPVRLKLGILRWPATALVLLFLLLAFVTPIACLLYLSFIGFWSRDVFSQPLSFDQYRQLLDFPLAVPALLNSLWLAGLASMLALLTGFAVSYRAVRSPNLGNRVLAGAAALPLGVPSIVLGLAFLVAFTGSPLPLYGTPAIIVLAYTVHVLPIASRNAEAALRQVAPDLEEAALICGDTRGGALRRVVLPLLRRPLVAAWALTFIILFRDLPISILLYTPATAPSAVAMMSIYDQGWLTGVAGYAIVITAISIGVVLLVASASRRSVGS